MCDICLKTPCDSRCPNADEPIVVHQCSNCGYGIHENKTYYNINGKPWCKSCIEECETLAEVEW